MIANPDKKADYQETIDRYSPKRKVAMIGIIKTLSDLGTATKGSGIADRIGLPISDEWIGIGGSISAIITMYMTTPPKP
jgi:hypothetical protein